MRITLIRIIPNVIQCLRILTHAPRATIEGTCKTMPTNDEKPCRSPVPSDYQEGRYVLEFKHINLKHGLETYRHQVFVLDSNESLLTDCVCKTFH
jgi:hypothetical protein